MTTATQTTLKVRMQRSELLRVLKHLVPLVSGKSNSIPILKCILLSAFDGDTVTLTGTDMATAIRVVCEAEVKEFGNGKVVIPARDLQTFLMFTSGQDVELSANDRAVTVTVGDDEAKFTIGDLKVSQFPGPPQDDVTPMFTIGRNDLTEIATAVGALVSTDDSKPWLECVFLKTNGGKLEAWATTGSAVAGWVKPVTVHTEGTALIEPKTLRTMTNLAAPGEEISVGRTERTARFDGHNFTVWGRLREGVYPEIWHRVPQEYPHSITVDRRELAGAVKLALRFAHDRDSTMKFTANQSALNIRCGHEELGLITRRLRATVNGEVGNFGMAARVFRPPLDFLKGNEVRIEIVRSRNPVRLVCTDQPHLTYIVMPLITF